MNISKIIRAFGHIDDKFLIEAEEAEAKKSSRFRFKPVLLAAAIGVFALGTTVFAISRADGLSKMKYAFDRYSGIHGKTEQAEDAKNSEGVDLTPNVENDYSVFEEYGEESPNPEEFPWLDSLDGYGTELEYGDETINPGEVRAAAVLCNEHYFYAVMQYAMPEEVMNTLSKIPEGKTPSFKHCRYEAGSGSVYQSIMPVSVEDKIYTFVTYSLGFTSLPDEVELTLSEFGYQSLGTPSDFVTLADIDVKADVSTKNLLKCEALISDDQIYSTDYGDAKITAELSTLGIIFRITGENKKSAEVVYDDKYFGVPHMKIYLKDGRIYGNGENYFALSHIIKGKTGWIDKGSEVYYVSLPFTKPADIYLIEKIEVYDIEFIFD